MDYFVYVFLWLVVAMFALVSAFLLTEKSNKSKAKVLDEKDKIKAGADKEKNISGIIGVGLALLTLILGYSMYVKYKSEWTKINIIITAVLLVSASVIAIKNLKRKK